MDMNQAKADVTRLYIAYFNRLPDAEGLAFWVDKLSSGAMTLDQIRTDFNGQPETLKNYPASMSNMEVVKTIYNNVLGREPDLDGWGYWAGELAKGLQRDVLIKAIIDGAMKLQGADAAYLNHKLDFALTGMDYLAGLKGLSPMNMQFQIDRLNGQLATVSHDADGFYTDKANITTLAKQLTGGEDADLLIGSGGSDTLIGGDSAFGDETDPQADDANDDKLYGGDGNDKLVGGIGDDLLHGGSGKDTMDGGADGDTYFVDHEDDVIIESANPDAAGRDVVISSIDYTLAFELEDLVLQGSAATRGVGNEKANFIADYRTTQYGILAENVDQKLEGGMGDDTLASAGGHDTLVGGEGSDVYVIRERAPQLIAANVFIPIANSDAGVTIIETEGGGDDDTVYYSGRGYILHEQVENLVLDNDGVTERGGSWGAGNALDNDLIGSDGANLLVAQDGADYIFGGNGDDRLNGGSGRDTLSGGAGADVFEIAPSYSSIMFINESDLIMSMDGEARDFRGIANMDVVQDFSSGTDTLDLTDLLIHSTATSGKIAFLGNAADFAAAEALLASKTNSLEVVYDQQAARLYVDMDGNGKLDDADVYVELTGVTSLTAGDFMGV